VLPSLTKHNIQSWLVISNRPRLVLTCHHKQTTTVGLDSFHQQTTIFSNLCSFELIHDPWYHTIYQSNHPGVVPYTKVIKSPYSHSGQTHKPVHSPARSVHITQQRIVLQRLSLCIARQQPCQQEHARAHLAWCSHPVPEDLGVQPRKEHQAYDPVCVAQGAAPQQQVGHVQGIPAAICLHHCPLKDIQPAVTTNPCLHC